MDVFDNDHDHEEPIVRYNSNVNRTILYVSMLSFSTILFLIFLFYFCFRCVIWRRSRHRAAIRRLTLAALHVSDLDAATAHRHAEPPNAGLDPAIIASLPTFAVGAKVLGGGGGTEAECAVCLNALEEEEKAKLLPNCDHFFHVDCIDTWLDSHSTCPLCRGEAKPQLEPEDREGPVGLSLGSAGIGAPVLFNVGVDCSGDNNDNSHDELSKSNGSNSRLSSFRRILSRERSSRRIQPSGHDDEDAGVDPDLERQ